jgi:hypothetical protein
MANARPASRVFQLQLANRLIAADGKASAITLDQLIRALEDTLFRLRDLQAAGVQLGEMTSAGDDVFFLQSDNPAVARRFRMEEG